MAKPSSRQAELAKSPPDSASQVPGCFGSSDLIFASHPADEERAFAWLTYLREHEIGWKEARQQLEDFLNSKRAPRHHIKKQLDEARSRMKPWLTD